MQKVTNVTFLVRAADPYWIQLSALSVTSDSLRHAMRLLTIIATVEMNVFPTSVLMKNPIRRLLYELFIEPFADLWRTVIRLMFAVHRQ